MPDWSTRPALAPGPDRQAGRQACKRAGGHVHSPRSPPPPPPPPPIKVCVVIGHRVRKQATSTHVKGHRPAGETVERGKQNGAGAAGHDRAYTRGDLRAREEHTHTKRVQGIT